MVKGTVAKVENKTALDTSVCIAILKEDEDVIGAVRNLEGTVFLTTLTAYELMLREHNLGIAEDFINSFELLGFDLNAAAVASEIEKDLKKRGSLIDKPDIFIAATAIANNCALATLNTKDFSRIERLRLVKLG